MKMNEIVFTNLELLACLLIVFTGGILLGWGLRKYKHSHSGEEKRT